MSNKVDFFLSEQTRLTLAATEVSVFVDGLICPFLEVTEIVYACWPDFSRAKLFYNSAVCSEMGLIDIERVETKIAAGKSIYIQRFFNNSAPDISVDGVTIFTGQIETVETKFDCSEQLIEFTARDFSSNLERITIYGQRVSNGGNSSLFLAGSETVFNESGKANAAIEPIENNGQSFTVFCTESEQCKPWSYAEVLSYLLCEYLPVGQLYIPGIKQLQSLTQNREVRDLDVTGLNLLQALHRCCNEVGLKFKFVPRFVPGCVGQAIVFYKNAEGRQVDLNCQNKGERIIISKTNISKLHSKKNFWPITHKYTGQGDFKVYESTFDLVKAWDSADEDTDYYKFSPSTNSDFYKLKNVYRKWCLNEAGDYSNSPYNQGDAFDFSKMFEGEEFIYKRRRFYPSLTTDNQDKSIGYFLQVSFDDGVNWWQYLYAFNVFPDECGIWLSADQLDIDTWIAALKGVLKFRITASVISDQRLTCAVCDGPIDSLVPVVEHVYTLPRRFRYRKVSAQSIFTDVSDDSMGVADEIDDIDALYDFVRGKADSFSEIIETTDLQTPYLVFDYSPGDRVVNDSGGRDLLGLQKDSRSKAWIERVQMDFGRQCTNLKIVRVRD